MATPDEDTRARIGIPTSEPIIVGARPKWTPQLVSNAFRLCEDGWFLEIADLCDALRTDGRIRGVLQTRTNALIGTPLTFDAAAPFRRTAQEVQAPTKNAVTLALEEGGEWWRICPESTFCQIMTWGLLLNMAVAEIVWSRDMDRGGIWMPRLDVKHPRNLRWDWNLRKWFLRVETRGVSAPGTLSGPDEIEIVPGDGRWFMFSPFGENTPWRHGLVWALALIWLAKQYAEYDWGRRNEARGRAALVGSTPAGTLDDDRKQFARDIAELRTKLGIALPDGYDLKAVEFGPDDHLSFATKVANAESSIAILILGQNLTTEVKNSGSYAAGKAQERVRQDYLEWDAEIAATGFHDGLLTHYARLRFNDASLAPYPIWDATPQESIAAKANVWARGAEALDKFLARGLRVDIPAYCKELGVPLLPGKQVPITGTQSSSSAPTTPIPENQK